MIASIDAERSLLGSIIVDNKVIDYIELTPEDFVQYGNTYEAMKKLRQARKPIDAVTLADSMGADFNGQEIAAIMAQTYTAANAKEYARIVGEKSIRRSLEKMAGELIVACRDDKAGMDDIATIADQMSLRATRDQQSNAATMYDLMLDAWARLEQRGKQKVMPGITTGYIDLDHITCGFQQAELTLIAARPSMGKTALALNMALSSAEKKQVLIFSLEMSKEQIADRFLAMGAMVDATKIKTGDLGDDEWERAFDADTELAKLNITVDDSAGLTIERLKSRCRKHKAKGKADIIFIDYLQLIEAKGESRQQQVSDISRALKAIARELNVPVVCLSQLSRAVEGRPDKRPMLSDLRDSGAIEQDADVVMFIYRDEYYNDESEDKGMAEVLVSKNRNGATGMARLAWFGDKLSFKNLDKSDREGFRRTEKEVPFDSDSRCAEDKEKLAENN